MRVYIGPYKDTWITASFHYDYMNKKYNYEWEESNTRFEKILKKLEDWSQTLLNATINKLIKHRKRKIEVRIDNYDIWSMDHTLAHIILPMLKQLKTAKNGSPYVDQEDIPEHLRLTEREDKVFNEGYWNEELKATEEEIEAASEKFHSQFDWVLDQMIWSFERELEEDDYHHYYDPYKPGEVLEDDGNDLISNEFKLKMGKFNNEKYKAYQAKKQLGFTLFGKYYQSLWS